MALSDLEVARAASMQPISEIGEKAGIPSASLELYGRYKAKIQRSFIDGLKDRPDGKLILVTAISPTPAGEGKTTTTIGLGDGLNAIGKNAMMALREPSLGPCFGMKGGAAGGGHAQVVPMEDINLHFTGDFHAISTAHNLLSALIDNHIHWGNSLEIDLRRITWKRVIDMNDRALRQITVGLGGPGNGFPREDGFDISVASEIMAIFCLASDFEDLERRLGRIIVGFTRDRTPVFARDLEGIGSMVVLLRDAFNPNLVQTLENNPVLIHGGPFANIAHGCNSVVATKTALKLADYVVTEAGFGADLGAEKFLDIKCRKAGLKPDCVVIVATIRALKCHGGVSLQDLSEENVAAVSDGLSNLKRHISNLKKYGVQPVVAINRFVGDSDREVAAVRDAAGELGVETIACTHWSDGGAGTRELAEAVVKIADQSSGELNFLYPDEMPILEKIEAVAREIYGADGISVDDSVRKQIEKFQNAGFGHFPVCIAKTQYSFSTDPSLKGAPSGHTIPIREIRLSNGAEFFVVVCGDIMTMPGLPRVPAANSIYLDSEGRIEGLS
ncbi:MAG: formate--tetrahydrofolate ligase [Verrucomicrobiales bacterium]|nr:formate--tetrahydrofolate ligase [Verrucomicrobiales bacterium]